MSDYGVPLWQFLLGLKQAGHNLKYPDHQCKCKSLEEMVTKSSQELIAHVVEMHFKKHLVENNETK